MGVDKVKNEPAFPVVSPERIDGGITKREYFAAMAMQGMLSYIGSLHYESISERAFTIADAMLAESEKSDSDK